MATSKVVTLGEVARAAGVSLATASRALNGGTRRVNAELAQKVVDAAAQLGYVPNVHAQAVARGSSSVVGLIVPDIDDPYFSAIAAGVIVGAERAGLVVSLGATMRNAEREFTYLSVLRAQRARAVVMVGSRSSDRALTDRLARDVAAFEAAGGRVACVSQPRLRTDTVVPENRLSSRELARALVGLGHTAFAVLCGPRQVVTGRDRLGGFTSGLADHGLELPKSQVIEGPFTRDGGYRAAKELLARDVNVTCVFAVNDVMAVGAMVAFREAGVVVPDDISVAGFDDIATLRDISPSLTTVRLPLSSMGEQALGLALSGPSERPRIVRVRGNVVLRESTRTLDPVASSR